MIKYKIFFTLFFLILLLSKCNNQTSEEYSESLKNNIIKNYNNKLAFVEYVSNGGFLEPPFGDIKLYLLDSNEIIRFNEDHYMDLYPTLSRKRECIYFESKRGKDAKFNLGAQSNLYKYDLNNAEITKARKDIRFALKEDSASDIKHPLISQSNNSLMAFIERGINFKRLVVCNLDSKKVLFDLNNYNFNHYYFTQNYFLARESYIEKFSKPWVRRCNLNTFSVDSIGDYFSGYIIGSSRTEDFLYEADHYKRKVSKDEFFINDSTIRNILFKNSSDFNDFLNKNIYEAGIVKINKVSVKDGSKQNLLKIDYSDIIVNKDTLSPQKYIKDSILVLKKYYKYPTKTGDDLFLYNNRKLKQITDNKRVKQYLQVW